MGWRSPGAFAVGACALLAGCAAPPGPGAGPASPGQAPLSAAILPSLSGSDVPVAQSSASRLARTSEPATYNYRQRLDDTWTISQDVRYDRTRVADGDWLVGAPSSGTDTYAAGSTPAMGTFDLGSQAQASFQTLGLTHGFKVGFDYLRSRDVVDALAPVPSLDIFSPGYGATIDQQRLLTQSYSDQAKLGMFVQDEIRLDRWTLSLVGRRDQLSNRSVDLNTPDSAASVQEDDLYSGRMGLRYQLGLGLSPYVNYSQTYAPRTSLSDVEASGQQYEAGIKYQPPGWGQLMTVTAYNQIQSNAQTGDAQAGCMATGCAAWAELRVRGATVESRVQPLAGLKLAASYALTSSSVMQASSDAYAAMLANRYPDVVQQQVTLAAQYAVTRGSLAGLSLDGRVGRAGANYSSAALPALNTAYTLVDAGINYDFAYVDAELKGLRLRASATNMFDRDYASYCYADNCVQGAHRSVSAILNYQVAWP